MTLDPSTPLALASLMYSESRTSSIEDRIRRMYPAAAPQANVKNGQDHRFELVARGFSEPMVPMTVTGTHSRVTANMRIAMIPT